VTGPSVAIADARGNDHTVATALELNEMERAVARIGDSSERRVVRARRQRRRRLLLRRLLRRLRRERCRKHDQRKQDQGK